MKHQIILLVLIFTWSVGGKMLALFDSKIDDCNAPDIQPQGFNFSTFELVPENDTLTLMNGSWVFTTGIMAPWRTEIQCQMYDRGEWLVKLVKTYPDLCSATHNPLEPAYFTTKFMPACPIKAGGSADYDMAPAQLSEAFLAAIPYYYAGRWRVVLTASFKTAKGKPMTECRRIYFDLYEV